MEYFSPLPDDHILRSDQDLFVSDILSPVEPLSSEALAEMPRRHITPAGTIYLPPSPDSEAGATFRNMRAHQEAAESADKRRTPGYYGL